PWQEPRPPHASCRMRHLPSSRAAPLITSVLILSAGDEGAPTHVGLLSCVRAPAGGRAVGSACRCACPLPGPRAAVPRGRGGVAGTVPTPGRCPACRGP